MTRPVPPEGLAVEELGALPGQDQPSVADAVPLPAPSLERRLALFFRECAQASWRGMDLDGGEIQDMAVRLGLFKVVPYDPEIHSGYNDDVDPGDDWFTYADGVLDLVHGEFEPPARTAQASSEGSRDELNTVHPPRSGGRQ